MKIAITGANGFVGSNLITHFQSCGHEVFALVRPSANLKLVPPGTPLRQIDYTDINSLKTACEGMDVLIHNAGKTKALSHAEMLSANLGITQKVISAINSLPQQIQLIYISSQAASRPSRGNKPVQESEASAPLTSYGLSKAAAEKAIISTCKQPFTIIRPCSVYGGGDRDFLQLFKAVKFGLSFQIGREDKLLNMIHISELAAFLGLCLQNPVAFNQVFFATDAQVYRQSQILAAIASALHKKPLHIVIPNALAVTVFQLGDAWGRLLKRSTVINTEKMKEIMAEGWLADPAKAKTILGWNPTADLNLHIRETAECYRALAWL